VFKASQPVDRSVLVQYDRMGKRVGSQIWRIILSRNKRLRVLTMIKQFTQRPRGASTSSLLTINGIQRLIYEQTGSKSAELFYVTTDQYNLGWLG
jgi:hypothetical protein